MDIPLILKDNAESTDDYTTALQLLARAEVVLSVTYIRMLNLTFRDTPDARRLSSYRRTWCRVYYHDEYVFHSRYVPFAHTFKPTLQLGCCIRKTSNVTDAQLKAHFCATTLYHTLIIILSTLAAVAPHKSLPEGIGLDPSQCMDKLILVVRQVKRSILLLSLSVKELDKHRVDVTSRDERARALAERTDF